MIYIDKQGNHTELKLKSTQLIKTEYDELVTQNKQVIPAINELVSQLDDIASAVGERTSNFKREGLENDDTNRLQRLLNSGATKIILNEKRYTISNTLIVPTTVRIIEGMGQDVTIIESTNSSADIFSFVTDVNNLYLSNFQITHTVKGSGHGFVFEDNNNHLYCEKVNAINCNIGFYSKYSTWMQNFKLCKANNCDIGYKLQGLNSTSGSSGTTVILEQSYTIGCKIGFDIQNVKEVYAQTIAIDHYTSRGIVTTNCNIVNIQNFHTESNTVNNYSSAIKIEGSNTIFISGVNIETTIATTEHYAIEIVGGGTAVIMGLTGENNSNIRPYAISEGSGVGGKYYTFDYTKSAFTSAYISLANGKLVSMSALDTALIPSAKGVSTVQSGAIVNTGLSRNPLPIFSEEFDGETLPTVGVKVVETYSNGQFKVRVYNLANGTENTTSSVRINWLAY